MGRALLDVLLESSYYDLRLYVQIQCIDDNYGNVTDQQFFLIAGPSPVSSKIANKAAFFTLSLSAHHTYMKSSMWTFL